MNDDIKFPLIELTDWVFEGEKAFIEILEEEANSIHYIKEKDIKKHYSRNLVDSKGYIIKINSHKIIKKSASLFSLFGPPTIEVVFELKNSGFQMPIEEFKSTILSRVKDIYAIKKLKLMSESEFVQKIKNSLDYEYIVKTATFLD